MLVKLETEGSQPPAPEYGTYKEGSFKASLKKLNPILEVETLYRLSPECTQIRDFIVSELQSNMKMARSAILQGIHNSLSLFKIAFEYHAPPSSTSTTSAGREDPIFDLILEPILPEILTHWNQRILSYCQLRSEELIQITDDCPAISSHQMISLVHKSLRIILALLKRMLNQMVDQHHYFPHMTNLHLQTTEFLFLALLNGTKLELPLDVKCNLGLGICYILKIRESPYLRYSYHLRAAFTSSSFISENPVNQLAFAFGLLVVTNAAVEEGQAADTDLGVRGGSLFEATMLQIGQFIFTLDHGSKEALNLGTARVLELWMEKLVESKRTVSPDLGTLFPDIEFFVFSYIPGHIDAVKACCRNILANLAKIYDKMEPSSNFTQVKALIERILVKPEHIKWIALCSVTRSTSKSTAILEIDPQISQTLLCSDRTMKYPASEAYLALMAHHLSQSSLLDWELTWIEPLFATQTQISPNETNWPQKRSIICSILKSGDSRIVDVMLNFVLRKMNTSGRSNGEVSIESSLLAVEVIKLATELKVEMKEVSSGSEAPLSGNYFRGLVPREVLHSWATSSRSQIRLASFSLLVETKKSSELISATDLESIKFLFKYNIASQNPAFRQQFLSYYKKLMKRLRDSRNLLVRNRDAINLGNYCNFFAWLWNFLTVEEGLFPGANFGRRCQSLEFLSTLLDTFDVETLKLPLQSNEDVRSLRWMFDTYEHNKKLVFPILMKLYTAPLQDAKLGDKLLDAAFRLCESVHPPDSVTGRYLGLFLIQHCQNGIHWITVEELLGKILEKLTRVLNSVKETSLIQVSSQTQMYGYFRFLRMLFSESIGLINSNNPSVYRPLALSILKLCYEFNEILLPVLGDAAPEGFLPGLPDSEPQNSQVVRSINAQRLLICSWRSMRDICMLLSELCGVLSIEGERTHFVWTFEEVKGIGDHLLFLLKNVMHRGVFEQVFTGFKQLAYRLFKSNSEKLSELPEKWLSDAMDEELISTKCITRRSAGLPFIFQALLSPMSTNEPFITKYVDRLFQFYDDADSESNFVRIHSTNVLRGLFKDTNFSKVMMPYVPKGLKLAFDQLKSPNWNECNAGLMLYGAIIRRTFGPSLNLMAAPTFFRRFPDMYDFLLGQVKTCAAVVSEEVKNPNYTTADDFTYQVLLLLSSFAVTGVVEYGPLKISEFIPPIHACGLSPDYQVREIASKALNPFLIKSSAKVEFIQSILEEYAVSKSQLRKRANEIHGDFLQILHVLKSIGEEELKTSLVEAFNNTFTAENTVWTCPCPTIYEALAEICIHLGPSTKILQARLQSFYSSIFDPIRIGKNMRGSFPGLQNSDSVLAHAEIQFSLYEPNPEHHIYDWLITKPMDFLTQLFTILSSRGFLQTKTSAEISMEELVIFDGALRRYSEEYFEYSAQMTDEESFLGFLASIDRSSYERWTEDPESLILFERVFEKALGICQSDLGTVECKGRALILLGKLTFQTNIGLSAIQREAVCDVFCSWCDPYCDLELRLAVAKSIPSIPVDNIQTFTILEECKLWFSVLKLMLDDEESVRNEINAKIGDNGADIHCEESEGGRSQYCERKSSELILGLFLTTFGRDHVNEALVLIVGLILRDDYQISVTDAEDNEEESLFERGEMNAYAEPLLLAKLLAEQLTTMPNLHSVLCHHFQKTPLTPDLVSLYQFVTNVKTLPQMPPESKTFPTLAMLTAPNPGTLVARKDGLNTLETLPEKELVQNSTLEFLCSLLSS